MHGECSGRSHGIPRTHRHEGEVRSRRGLLLGLIPAVLPHVHLLLRARHGRGSRRRWRSTDSRRCQSSRLDRSAEAYAKAAKHRISKYLRVTGTSLNALKTCLSAGFPIVFGFTVYPSFESQATAATGLVHMPAHGERPVGGHAVLAVGYDDSLQALIVRNSWGEGWGDKGYFYMPYKYATNASLADDFWTLRK